jgi:hypothetical protein
VQPERFLSPVCAFPRVYPPQTPERSPPAIPRSDPTDVDSFSFRRLRRSCVKSASSRRCGEMADATDLKSVFAKAKCGFESRHRQPLKSDFKRESGEFLGSAVANRRGRKRSKSQTIRQLLPDCISAAFECNRLHEPVGVALVFLNVRSRDSCDGLGCQKPKPRRNRESRSAISLRPHSVFSRRRREPSRTHASRRSAIPDPVGANRTVTAAPRSLWVVKQSDSG